MFYLTSENNRKVSSLFVFTIISCFNERMHPACLLLLRLPWLESFFTYFLVPKPLAFARKNIAWTSIFDIFSEWHSFRRAKGCVALLGSKFQTIFIRFSKYLSLGTPGYQKVQNFEVQEL